MGVPGRDGSTKAGGVKGRISKLWVTQVLAREWLKRILDPDLERPQMPKQGVDPTGND